jgi:hypothetical protein
VPIVRRAQFLDLTRLPVQDKPQPTAEASLALMPRLDKLRLEHRIVPHALRSPSIDRPAQVGAMETPFILTRRDPVYLTVELDTASRQAQAPLLPIGPPVATVIEALDAPTARNAAPKVTSPGQGGTQFTAAPFVDVLSAHGARIAMYARGC